MRRSVRAFSLIELLVVVTIVAILAALLMPAIAMVRRSADATACGNALRQTSLSAFAYIDEHEGTVPPTNWDGAIWAGAIGQLVEGDVAWDGSTIPPAQVGRVMRQCPVRRRQGVSPGWPFHYGALTVVMHEGGGWNYMVNVWGGPWRNERAFTLSEMPNKTNRVWLGDSDNWWLPEYWDIPLDQAIRRHGGRSNILAFDGHVERVLPDDFYRAANAPWLR